jgi:hypothetical protein
MDCIWSIPKNNSQQKITKWVEHKPFIQGVQALQKKLTPHNSFVTNTKNSTEKETQISTIPPTHPRQHYTDHLAPFGTPLSPSTSPNILCVCFQNTQHSFRIHGDNIELPNITSHLQSFGIGRFAPISPYVNWLVSNNWPRTRQLFRPHFQQFHLSATSSDIGKDPNFLINNW